MHINKFCVILFFTCLLLCDFAFGQTERDSVKIYFRQGNSVVDLSYANNKTALDRVVNNLISKTSTRSYNLKNITIIGGTSPEGSILLNKRISEQRANALFDYLSHYFSLESSLKNYVYLGRDWSGLLQLVQGDDNVPFRDDVITLLGEIIERSENNAEADDDIYRLQTMWNGEPYRYMYSNLFPELRASQMILLYDKIMDKAEVASVADNVNAQTSVSDMSGLDITSPISVDNNTTKGSFCMGIKTNLLYDALLVPNIGVEFYLGKRFSLATNWMYAWWNNDSKHTYWRVYGGDVSLRKWLGRRSKVKPLAGHHLGIYAQALTYDLADGDRGFMAGEPSGDIFDRANYAAGLEYGYSVPVARRLNLDFTLGVGYMWGRYYEYNVVDNCYVWQATKNRQYIGPTKAEISLVWLLGRKNVNAEKGGRR